MRIHTRIEWQWDDETRSYLQTHEEGYNLPENGKISLCKGADPAQTNIANTQSQFYNTLTNDYSTQFAQQGNILSSLQRSLEPTVAAGPSQFGYSTGETNALNSQAIQGTAQQYQNAQKSLQNQQAAQGGGNMQLPSGVAAQNNANLAATGANQASNQLLGIQQAGYNQGNQNYNNAVSALNGAASIYNPSNYANVATGAGNSAFTDQKSIQTQNDAANPWTSVGGILGGVAGSFLGPIGTSVGSSLGSSLGGMFSGSGSDTDNSGMLSDMG